MWIWRSGESSIIALGLHSHWATRAASGSQDTTNTRPVTRSYKRYNLRSHKQKPLERSDRCEVRIEEAEDSTLWNAALEVLFVELFMEESNVGRIFDGNFNVQAQVTVTATLNQSGLTRIRLTTKQVKGKWNRMKRNYSDFTFVLKQTGFGWRPEADTVDGTDEAWSNVMSPPFTAPIGSPLQNNPPPVVLYKRASHGSCSLGSKGKKAKLELEMSDACCAMTNLCNSRTGGSSAIRGYNHEPPINQCIRWLSSLEPPLSDDSTRMQWITCSRIGTCSLRNGNAS
ncbi:hypothetical protein CJ030_MR2G017936 [Morella rubra]|uniref:Myb/SANT-like domain-containing protein n=1 Tax=Morella rubra TaxID=262757 RepID=A0A6A1WDR7_9ROSI|nr:hypothetical protein CJ030_MR2G017936 [Morella rubra]